MKDIVGNEVFVGDFVIVSEPNYAKVIIGMVIKVSPKSAQYLYITAKAEKVRGAGWMTHRTYSAFKIAEVSEEIKQRADRISKRYIELGGVI